MERNNALERLAERVPSPCYVIDTHRLRRNLEILYDLKQKTGCKILLALKGFATWAIGDLVSRYLDGVSASGYFEARLGAEHFGKEVHVCSPAYTPDEINKLAQFADHVVFNSLAQFEQFARTLKAAKPDISLGLRINPMHSEVDVQLYDPCAPGSRLGITRENFPNTLPAQVDGLHFHTLCEQNADALQRTLAAVEQQFGRYFHSLQWVNFGGGHHITRPDYDIELLRRLICDFKKRYDVQVYLEPGEAVALNAGYLIATVLDIVHNELDIAILDTSAAAHMPDVLEMPYRPQIEGAGLPGERPYTYRLAGKTCLAGDVIGDYSFDKPLQVGTRLVFHDMAHYTMVKNTTFNGLPLPDIVLYDSQTGQLKVQRHFTYEDFKNRLS